MTVDVHRHLNQRPPFLFVDSATIESSSSIVTTVCFNSDAEFFKGHFPGDPVVPGVLLIEAMAQSARLLVNYGHGTPVKGYLVGIEVAKFNSIVRPGMTLNVRTALVADYSQIKQFSSGCFHGRTRCARARLSLQLVA